MVAAATITVAVEEPVAQAVRLLMPQGLVAPLSTELLVVILTHSIVVVDVVQDQLVVVLILLVVAQVGLVVAIPVVEAVAVLLLVLEAVAAMAMVLDPIHDHKDCPEYMVAEAVAVQMKLQVMLEVLAAQDMYILNGIKNG